MAAILVIEDNPAYNQMVKLLLEAEGHDVKTAFNGALGLQLFKERKFDLVLTDIFMPEMEGLETIRELKSLNPDIKVISMSGGGTYQDLTYLKFTRDLGADRIFVKPFDNRELLKAIDELVA